ncbi:MAG: hypothetical protein HGA49_09355, partial [Eubacteriaceae bacterium]|nr:hypothetical protein [Eubacteriaceae bacterium]
DFDVSSFLLELKQEYLFKSESNDLQEQLSADIRYSIVASVIVMMGFILELERAECTLLETLLA